MEIQLLEIRFFCCLSSYFSLALQLLHSFFFFFLSLLLPRSLFLCFFCIVHIISLFIQHPLSVSPSSFSLLYIRLTYMHVCMTHSRRNARVSHMYIWRFPAWHCLNYERRHDVRPRTRERKPVIVILFSCNSGFAGESGLKRKVNTTDFPRCDYCWNLFVTLH